MNTNEILKALRNMNCKTALIQEIAVELATGMLYREMVTSLQRRVAELEAGQTPGTTTPAEPRNVIDETALAWREGLIARASELTREWGIDTLRPGPVQSVNTSTEGRESLEDLKQRMISQAARLKKEFLGE